MDDRHRRYFEEMPCFLTVHDRDLRILDGNRRFRDHFGEHQVGERCYRVYKQREDVCPDCPVEQAFATGEPSVSEQLLLTRQGEEIPVRVRTTPMIENGEVVSVLAMHTDIRRSLALQEQLRRSEQRLAQLFEEVPCYISVQGPDLVVRHANRAFRETFGPAVGDHCYRVYKHRSEPCMVCPSQAAFATGEVQEHEEVVVSAAGDPINVLVVTTPVRNRQGEVEAVMEMSSDITQIRQLQSQLTSIGLLVGSISHGIKGLLTGLDGGIYLVNSGFTRDDPDRIRRGWDMVQRNVERIRSMVLDILYYAKDRELILEEINADRLVEELGEVLGRKAEDLGVELDLNVAAGEGEAATFQGDHKAVRATLVNLLENSLEACRAAADRNGHRVSLVARRLPPWIVFDIEDSGIGMDRETREKLFSLFFSSKGVKGTGLGLFIANKIVAKHGGSIEVESEAGRGSRFLIRMPIEARPSTPPRDD